MSLAVWAAGGGGSECAWTLTDCCLRLRIVFWSVHTTGKHLKSNTHVTTQIQKKFEADGSVQLQRFLTPAVADPILTACAAADEAQGMGRGRMPPHAAGCSDGG